MKSQLLLGSSTSPDMGGMGRFHRVFSKIQYQNGPVFNGFHHKMAMERERYMVCLGKGYKQNYVLRHSCSGMLGWK